MATTARVGWLTTRLMARSTRVSRSTSTASIGFYPEKRSMEPKNRRRSEISWPEVHQSSTTTLEALPLAKSDAMTQKRLAVSNLRLQRHLKRYLITSLELIVGSLSLADGNRPPPGLYIHFDGGEMVVGSAPLLPPPQILCP